MTTVDYIDVLQGCADLCGLDRDNLSTSEQAILRTLLSKRLGTAHINQEWPDLCRVEKRYFRPVYDNAATYAAQTEVYFPQTQACYQALVSTTGNAPANGSGTTDYTRWALCQTSRSASNYSAAASYVAGDQVYDPATDAFYQAIASSTGIALTDASKWAVVNLFSRYVSKDQAGKTPIGTVWGVWDKDPRTNADACEVEWKRSENGIQVVSDVPLVWVQFRLREPVLKGAKYDSTASYATGQQVYFKSAAVAGNMYNALASAAAGESPESAPSKWDKVLIPAEFRGYLEMGAASDFLAPTDDTEGDRYRILAEGYLGDAAMVLLGQEGQRQRTEVGVR